MALRKYLTIENIEIRLVEDGRALYDPPGKQRAAVEKQLEEYQDFIERWLAASEEPSPERLTPEETDVRQKLKNLVKFLRRTGWAQGDIFEGTVAAIARQLGNDQKFTAKQIDESIDEALSI